MKIEMYSKEQCSQCEIAVIWLQNQGINVVTLKLDVEFDRETLFKLFPMARSYPQFILDGEPIGDFGRLKSVLDFEQNAAF
ncbi:glutaredoxin [Photobacterium damselae subsp. piscicida]|uniref:glutaredoxin family protein n=1 Tax=Photobacterium damselae TaxID=38293 RepID=UPI0009F01854|nr:glutaredoxin domain-containing protein [Photobacterium damselae]MDP2516809.1 glutaredoxin [Photobacterium damselae subsp. piscicida]MDP2534150.1 glutaredoxin [Photobacterium damselae subsp. piscicida]MDP2543310.1 glutaredoxin [Photobacterium damselae subsp. piscicida]MDP2558445.1 glutaredoxin [Photobacterium damselae subsp. piscicida]MDP2570333.1 glutaredoxin [Photobacterium damselae subsp. piscicida]